MHYKRQRKYGTTASGHADLTGRLFGDLLVLGRMPGGKWRCVCNQCGGKTIALTHHLTRAKNPIKSCGRIKHRMIDTPEFKIWVNIRRLCRDPRQKEWQWYGGRGIEVVPEWDTFEAFYADMGPRPGPDYWLKRRDTDADYSPDNCYWRPIGEHRWSGRKVATDIEAKKREREQLRDMLKKVAS